MALKPTLTIAAALLLTACGSSKSMLTSDVFNKAAQDCGAQNAKFVPSAVKDGAPDIHVVDTKATVNGQQVDVPRCVSAKLSAYTYGRMVLDAAPPAKTR